MSAGTSPPDVVVAGAGLGGLTCAAYLALAGRRVVVLERSARAGGACQTLQAGGARFVVGTNTFGQHCARILKELGAPIAFAPAPFCLSKAGGHLYFPFRSSLFSAARRLGLGLGTLMKLLPRLGRLRGEGHSYADAVEALTEVPALRELLFAEAWYLGAAPESLPAAALQVFFSRYYGYHQPIYPMQGADAVPDALVARIRKSGGEVRLACAVDAIVADQRGVRGVQVDGQVLPASQVVSNLPPANTQDLLAAGGGALPPAFAARIACHSPSLAFAALLLRVDGQGAFARATAARAARRSSTLLLTGDVRSDLHVLLQGHLPERPMVNVVSPAAMGGGGDSGALPVTALTLWPHGGDTRLAGAVERTVLDALEREWPGFGAGVRWRDLLTPARYASELGICSKPAPALDTRHDAKLPYDWPIPGLYAAGSAFGAAGNHAAAAMESGRLAARKLLIQSQAGAPHVP